MMETTLFCENFWGEKHQGFDILYQNMKAGLKTSVEILEFLREIYSMEDYCVKTWIKLSKQLNVNASGSLQPLWLSLKELSEKQSAVHLEAGQGVQSIIKYVHKYMEEQQVRQKATKDTDVQTQNFNNLLLTTASQLLRAKETYHSRYAELQKTNLADINAATKSREIEKMEQKLKKAVDEYKYLIEKYNNTCVKFKSKMSESCGHFQDIETYHLEQMKDFIQRFGQSFLKAQNELTIQQKDFLNYQEKQSVECLLETFIKSKFTGKTPPEMVTFEEADITLNQKLTKVYSDTSNDSGLNGNHSSDPATGNLVNIDSWSDISSTRVSNHNLSAQPMKDCVNDIFDRLSSVSDNNTTNHNTGTLPEPCASSVAGVKKQKKYNNIFRRRRNSPTNGGNLKSLQDIDKEKSSQSLGDFLVDEEGYSIKPTDVWNENPRDSDSDSSSIDDQGESTFKGIKIEIKPQETKSTSSSIPDIESSSKIPADDNLDLIKAVQAIKIAQPGTKDNTRRLTENRSHTPSSLKETKERYSSQSSSERDFGQFAIRDSRRKKDIAPTDNNSKLSQPNFQIDFDKSFESNGPDQVDPFSKKFEALTSIKDERAIESDSDPWICRTIDGPGQPPPLPAKITPPRAASALPFTHQRIGEPSRSAVVPPVSLRVPPPPSRTTFAAMEGIPLAIAFTETVNATFREQLSTTPHDVHTNGQLVISFPCSMVQQLESLGETQLLSVEPVHFTLVRAKRLRNVEPIPVNKDVILRIENPSEDLFSIYIDLLSLYRKLRAQRQKEPTSPFFNVEIIKYDVTNNVRSNGSINAPVYISANWQFGDPLTSHLIISYSFQWPNTNVGSLTFRPTATTMPSETEPDIPPRGEVRFLVSADGGPQKMQSLPPCVWNSELGRASWRLDLSAGRSSIKSKFHLGHGPGTSQPVICQFSAEGAIESGVLLQVAGNRFRISRHKYRLISGRYMWEPSPNGSGGGGFCV